MRFFNSITKRKDGRYMGKFIIGYDDRGKRCISTFMVAHTRKPRKN